MNEIDDIFLKRQALIAGKLEMQARLTALNTFCIKRIDTDRYVAIQKERKELSSRISETDLELSKIKCENRARSLSENGPIKRLPAGIVRELSDLRDKWGEVAADENFHPPYRLAASQIVRDLNPILKRLCAP